MRIFDSCIDSGCLELSGMEFHAYHGCLEIEKTEGNLFVVDVKAEIDPDMLEKAAKTDSLRETIDVNVIYDLVSKEMSKRCNLIETVAYNILQALRNASDSFLRIEVRVSKHNPPLAGKCEWSGITTRWEA